MATKNSINSNDPIEVSSGGTGASTLTAYAVTCGGTTSTGAIQSIASVGTADQVLTSNGAAALPTFQDAGGGGLTPAFSAYVSSNINDVTGDGTTYNIIFDSEDFDIGSDFNTTTGLFTAPSTGKYMFSGSVRLGNQSGSTIGVMNIKLSSSSKPFWEGNPANGVTSNGIVMVRPFSYILDLTAADTVGVNVVAYSGSGKVDDVMNNITYFSGYLIG